MYSSRSSIAGQRSSLLIARHLGTFPMSPSSLNGIVGKRHHHIHLNYPILRHNNSADCCDSAVHRSIMAGICGNSTDGAYSIALSSLYEDDEDGGDVMYGPSL